MAAFRPRRWRHLTRGVEGLRAEPAFPRARRYWGTGPHYGRNDPAWRAEGKGEGAMKTRTPVARGSRDCFRTRNVSAPCDVCGARPEVVHIPCMAGASDAPSTARTAGRRQIFEIMRTSWYWTLQRSSDSAHNTSGERERGPDRGLDGLSSPDGGRSARRAEED